MNKHPRTIAGHIVAFVGCTEYLHLLVVVGIPVGFAALRWNILGIADKVGIVYDARVDVIAIPIDLTPEDYGYTVWAPSDITGPESTDETIDSVGFPGRSFPAHGGEYDTDQYGDAITNPQLLTIRPQHASQYPAPSNTGFLGIGFDTDQGTESSYYNGFSGSPVLGDGLVGIYEANQPVPVKNMKTGETRVTMAIIYWRADILTDLPDQRPSQE